LAEEQEGKGREREGGEVEGRQTEGPKVTVEPWPLRALLRHWRLFKKLFAEIFVTSGTRISKEFMGHL